MLLTLMSAVNKGIHGETSVLSCKKRSNGIAATINYQPYTTKSFQLNCYEICQTIAISYIWSPAVRGLNSAIVVARGMKSQTQLGFSELCVFRPVVSRRRLQLIVIYMIIFLIAVVVVVVVFKFISTPCLSRMKIKPEQESSPQKQEGNKSLDLLAAHFCLQNFNKTASVIDMLSDLKWDTLKTRRKKNRLTLMYKLSQNLVDMTTENHLIPNSEKRTRNSHAFKYRMPKVSKDIFKFSFFPRSITEWNLLPSDLVNCKSLANFKLNLGKHVNR